MPGPFSSESYRGTFDNDISKIKQNEILSSKTFNNFVRSLYNLFYTDDVYRNVYKSSGQEASSIIMTEANAQSDVQGPGWNSSDPDAHPVNHEMATTYLWIKNVDNSYDPETYSTSPEGHLCITPVSSDTDVLNDVTLNTLAEKASMSPEHLFYGTGDVSVSVKPYALFRTAVDSNSYCCITYLYGEHTGDDVSGYSEGTYTPKYSSMAEIVFIYDPTIDSGDTAIRKVWGMSGSAITDEGGLPTGEAYTRLTIIYGSAVTLAHLKAFLDSLTFQAEGSSAETQNVFKTVFVGDVDQNIFLYQLFAYLEDMKKYGSAKASLDLYTRDDTQAFTRVTRFVPVRSSIKISNPSVFWENLTASTEPDPDPGYLVVNPRAITAYVGKYSVTGTEQTDDSDQAGRLRFTHTGVYGFIINNTLNSDNMEVYSDGQPARFIYIPNKEHYENNHYVPGTDSTAIPDWAASNGDGGLPNEIERALTTDFDANYFFLPLITVTDTMLLFAGGGVISLRDAVFNGNTVISIPADGSGTNLESGIIYDAWNHPDRCNNELFRHAHTIYKKYRKGLQSVYRVNDDELANEKELIDLDTFNPKPVNSLVRTLQMMTGLTWQLSNIIWLDRMIGGFDECNPALKMFDSYESLFEYEDQYSGRGSILTDNSTVCYITRDGNPVNYEIDLSRCTDNPNHAFPSHVNHICLSVSGAWGHPVTDPDFFMSVIIGSQPKYGELTLVFTGSTEPVPDVITLNSQYFDYVESIRLLSADSAKISVSNLNIIGGNYHNLAIEPGLTETVTIDSARVYGERTAGLSHVAAPVLRLNGVTQFSAVQFTPIPARRETTTPKILMLDNLHSADIDITFMFEPWSGTVSEDYWTEQRNVSNIHSLIEVGDSGISDCNLKFRIWDKGNTESWTAPDGETIYPAGTWQAFDPDLLLPKDSGNSNSFSDTFMFLDCGLYSDQPSLAKDSAIVNTKITIDLTEDWTRQELTSISGRVPSPTVDQCLDSRFFASRFFRRSPYVFYFGSEHPYHYSTNKKCHRSKGVNLEFILKDGVDRMAVVSDISNTTSAVWPRLPQVPDVPDANAVNNLLTAVAHHIFISGLVDSTIVLPNLFMPPVTKRSYSTDYNMSDELAQLSSTMPSTTKRGAIVLFEAMAYCDIQVDGLYTTYPLQDEWKYSGVHYFATPTEPYEGEYSAVYWEEPEYGFQFFTYPRLFSGQGTDLRLNTGCRLCVRSWTSRANISGMYGVYNSNIDICYIFDTQAASLTRSISSHDLPNPGFRRWDLNADPGVLCKKSYNWSYEGETRTISACYLPATPFFYLAETLSSTVSFTQSPTNALTNSLVLGGTHRTSDSNGARELYATNPVPDFRSSRTGLLSRNAKRPVRLVIGYLFDVSTTGQVDEVVAPSSYNTIICQATRVNLVMGLMNKVSGWCYKLYATAALDFIPQNYHASGGADIFDLYCPGSAFDSTVLSDNLQKYGKITGEEHPLDPLPIPEGQNSSFGTLRPIAVTKELACDLSVPGTFDFTDTRILRYLSFLHADYPNLTTTGRDTTANKNAVVYSSSCEIGYLGYGLTKPGYYKSGSSPWSSQHQEPTNTGVGYAGHLPGTGARVGDALNPIFNYVPNVTYTFDQRTPMVNALNVVELHTILIATSSISYVGSSEDIPNEVSATYTQQTILQGTPLHTVVAVGYAQDKGD